MNMFNRPANDRGLQVSVNPAAKQVQLMMLAGGHPIPGAAITFTLEQAIAHRAGMDQAIAALQMSKGPLILPPGIGKPFQP